MFKSLILTAVLAALPVGAAHATVKTEAGLTSSVLGKSETYRLNVPTEKEISTTEVRLVIPAGVTVIRFQTMPGFTRTITKNSAGLVTEVVWKGRIAPMEFARFLFSASNPEVAATVVWKVYQKYSDGSVVAWDDSDPEQAPASKITIK
ncbi:MAG: nuclear export factor [Deinococcus sp.]|nr:nuclear export factor [Deinococcus sp.]